jgi:GAF domain-containing protein/HAMP domain-containing protein
MTDLNPNPNTGQVNKIVTFLRRWPISRRLMASALVSVISFVLIFGFLINNARFIFTDFNKLINDTTDEIQTLAELNIAVQALSSETREYALHQEENTLDKIKETLLTINNNSDQLFKIGTDFEEQEEAKKEAQLFEALKADLQELENGTEGFVSSTTVGANEENILETIEELEVVEQSIIQLLDEISTALQQESVETITQINQRIVQTLIFLTIGILSLLLLNLAISHFSTDSIAAPIQHLVDTAKLIAKGDLNITADESGKDEISTLANAFNQMNARQKELIASEVEISQKLQENLAQLQASTMVAQVVTSILDPTEIIEKVVNLIKEAFGLYYVGLFTPDELEEWAVLRTGTGEAGQMMLARGHRIKIGEGMIGWSIANKKPRVAQVAGDDFQRLATAELPETRSEAAIPLLSRGKAIGALTVQDRRSNFFDEQLITILQNMADQVAIALDNARLFAENQEALEASRRAYFNISREEWAEFLEVQQDLNYLATPQVETQMQANDWTQEMVETYSLGEITRHGENTIHIPINLRDQTLGVVRLRKQDGTGGWSDEEVQLMDTIVDQLETALETARLYSNTQIQAGRERLTHEVTDKLHRSHDMDTLMQTLLREISNALGASSAFVQLSTDLTASASVNSNPITNN